MYKASYFEIRNNKYVKCILCPNNCIIKPDESGICKVRKNIDGILYSEVYGKVSGYRFDPIEKKPLYHFYPGSDILSIGTLGCNLKCQFCQNCEISQPNIFEISNYKSISKEKILNDCVSNNKNIGLAFTYNEPTVWFEFMKDLAVDNKSKGLFNVMVSNGYINEDPLIEILEYIDAFNIDLKGFDDTFYIKNTKSRLQPVLDNLKKIRKSGKHLEITNLIIPHENDNVQLFKDMISWIKDNLGESTVLHLSRYFPNYHFDTPPTLPQKLMELYNIASEELNYVYLGNINVENGSDTFCPSCQTKIIERLGYSTVVTALNDDGKCRNCNYPVDIVL